MSYNYNELDKAMKSMPKEYASMVVMTAMAEMAKSHLDRFVEMVKMYRGGGKKAGMDAKEAAMGAFAAARGCEACVAMAGDDMLAAYQSIAAEMEAEWEDKKRQAAEGDAPEAAGNIFDFGMFAGRAGRKEPT